MSAVLRVLECHRYLRPCTRAVLLYACSRTARPVCGLLPVAPGPAFMAAVRAVRFAAPRRACKAAVVCACVCLCVPVCACVCACVCLFVPVCVCV